jgi:hypothetical protein
MRQTSYLTGINEPIIQSISWTDWNNNPITFSGNNSASNFYINVLGPITLHVSYTNGSTYSEVFNITPLSTPVPTITGATVTNTGTCPGSNDASHLP